MHSSNPKKPSNNGRMEKEVKFDLGVGNSVAVRKAFLDNCFNDTIKFNYEKLVQFDYPVHSGDPLLVKTTRAVIKRQIGLEYKHIFITNGATGGCVIAMRAYQQRGFEWCMTRTAPWYGRYPSMIKAAGLYEIDETFSNDCVALIDLPSNPLNRMDNIARPKSPVIMDGVYLNRVCMEPISIKTIPHDVYVASYSKLLGINGIRLGWIATNDDLIAERIKDLVTSEYCGISTASQEILNQMLPYLNWDQFEASARHKMGLNREQFSKLEKYFGNTPVQGMGMFYYAPTDKKCTALLNKAGIAWSQGSGMGTTDEFGRFNLGQDNQLTEQAVKAILKADKI